MSDKGFTDAWTAYFNAKKPFLTGAEVLARDMRGELLVRIAAVEAEVRHEVSNTKNAEQEAAMWKESAQTFEAGWEAEKERAEAAEDELEVARLDLVEQVSRAEQAEAEVERLNSCTVELNALLVIAHRDLFVQPPPVPIQHDEWLAIMRKRLAKEGL